MERIKRILIIFILFFLLPLIVNAGTELSMSTQHPIVNSSIYVQLDLMYCDEQKKDCNSDALSIRDFHTIITYDPSYFRFERIVWLQGGGSYSTDGSGTIYIDKEAGKNWICGYRSGAILQMKFTVLKSGQSRIDVKRNGDSHYGDGNIIGQSFAGIYIDAKEPSTSVLLSGLYINGYDIQPTFNKMHNEYYLTVPSNVDYVVVTAQKGDPNQTITGDGKRNLVYGDNKIHVVVKAQNESTNTYTINVIRVDDRTGDTTLKTITVGNEVINVEENVQNYEVTVSRSVDNILLNARTTDSYATLIGTGRKNLNIGANKFTLTVESSNGKKREYTITVNRSTEEFEVIENSNKLQSIKVNGLNLDLSNDNNIWYYGINSDHSELTINTVTESKTAKVEIIGNQNLEPGLNIIEIKVIEMANVTSDPKSKEKATRTYTLVVYKNPNDVLVVSSLDTIPSNNNIFYRTTDSTNSTISANILTELSKYNKKLYYNVVNMYNGIKYQAIIPGISTTTDLNVNFAKTSTGKYTTSLPSGIEILLNVAEEGLKDNTNVKIYTYNEGDSEYTLLTDGLTVQNGYLRFTTDGNTNYIITGANLADENGPFVEWFINHKNILIIIGITLIAIILVAIIISKIKQKNKANELQY